MVLIALTSQTHGFTLELAGILPAFVAPNAPPGSSSTLVRVSTKPGQDQ
jgi:hypothetical protein